MKYEANIQNAVPATPLGPLNQNFAGNVESVPQGLAINSPTQPIPVNFNVNVQGDNTSTGFELQTSPMSATATEGASFNPTMENTDVEGPSTFNSMLTKLNDRLKLVGRGVWSKGNQLLHSEGMKQTAQFAFYIGKQAAAGAIEGSGLTEMDSSNAMNTELESDEMIRGARVGAIIGGAKALHRSAKRA